MKRHVVALGVPRLLIRRQAALDGGLHLSHERPLVILQHVEDGRQ